MTESDMDWYDLVNPRDPREMEDPPPDPPPGQEGLDRLYDLFFRDWGDTMAAAPALAVWLSALSVVF
jgi:hypothetical protein